MRVLTRIPECAGLGGDVLVEIDVGADSLPFSADVIAVVMVAIVCPVPVANNFRSRRVVILS